ncbi:hypothetical protein E2I00_008715, partial [Balaenoptera physalus]
GILLLSTQHTLRGGDLTSEVLPGSPATFPGNETTHPLRLWEDHPYFRALPTDVGQAGDCNPRVSWVRSRRQVRGRGGIHYSPLPSPGLGVWLSTPVALSVYLESPSKLGCISTFAPSGAPPAPEAGRKAGRALPLPALPGEVGSLKEAQTWRLLSQVFPLLQAVMTPKPAGPPDGGWGWVVAAAAFADTAWVSALALAVQQAASEGGPRGPVGSALSTRWGARPVVMVGGVLTSLGFVFSAFARSLLHLYLGLGVLAGEERGIPGFFRGDGGDRSVSGAGGRGREGLLRAAELGWWGQASPAPVLTRSYPFAGSGWALVFAPALGTLSRYFSRRTALVGGGYFVPYVHLAPHALDRGLGGYGAVLVVAVAAVGDAGARLLCGWLADQGWVPLPRLLAMFGALTGLGLLAVGLVPVVRNEESWGGPLLAAAGAYGLSAGSYAPLVFGVLPGLVGIGDVVQATGLVMMLMSLGGLLGPPLSGFLRDETGDFTASFLVCGSFILSGSFIYVGLPSALPSCRPASHPGTAPPERGELLPDLQVALLPPGGPHSTLDTTC